MKVNKDKKCIYLICLNVLFYIYFFLLDFLLVFLCGIEFVRLNLFHIIVVNLLFSIILNFLYNIFSFNIVFKWTFIFIFIFIINVLYLTEIIIYNTFTNFYSIHDIIMNTTNVFSGFGTDVVLVIKKNFWAIVYYLFIFVMFFVLLNYVDKNYNNENIFIKSKLHFVSIVLIVFLTIISYVLIDKNIMNFNLFFVNNGLKSSIFFDILPYHKDYNMNFIYLDTKSSVEDNDIIIVDNDRLFENDNIDKENNVNNIIDTINNSEEVNSIINDINEDNKVYTKEHKWNIDFETAWNEHNDTDIILMDSYIKSKKPAKENKYTGLFTGKNLILICAEAFSNYIVDKDLTPTLYRLFNNGFRLNDFYQPCWCGGTSGGEYSFLTGLVPTDYTCSTFLTIGHEMTLTMPSMLKKEGYTTGAFHNGSNTFYNRHLTHGENLGFDFYMASGQGLDEMGLKFCNDDIFFEKTLPLYKDLQPFCMYYLTLTGHAFYDDRNNYKVHRYIDRVKARYGDKYSKNVENYICSQLFLEDGLKNLLKSLEDNGMIDDTVICMVPDHYPYGLTNDRNGNPYTDGINYVNELYGVDEYNNFERDKNGCIIWCGSLEKEDKKYVVDINFPTFTLDILPTLLNLFDLDYDSRLLIGNDIFSNYEHLVYNYDEDFMTDDVIYFNERRIARDKKTNEVIEKKEINEEHMIVRDKITYSKFVLNTDYYRYIEKYRKK